MTDIFHTVRVETEQQINEVAHLAEAIWHEHFTPIIGTSQVNYMIDKFQSVPALKLQLKDGYEYYQIFDSGNFCGYCGVHPENEKLFLSKLYIKKEFRGRHLASKAFDFLTKLCKERGLVSIWLTCNKENHGSLAVYCHLGFKTVDTQVADIGNGYVMDDYIMEYAIPPEHKSFK
ncbi:MAG: GNAT family N-acetyltransferase [Ruminococcus sp.]|jgi:ribosomal protein S18 acetylase RimI-like enzyme|nr:GNAT family N-acetyltransferase [Ruminococcus sp.]